MDIYHYHPETFEFVGAGKADADPLQAGNWLIPASATTVQPIAPQTGFAVCFDKGVWGYVEDHRGETWWNADGKEITISELGPIPADYENSPPPPPPAPEPIPLSEQLSAMGIDVAQLKTLLEATTV
jgi:hypothetical protein